jgi:hypothetical protein
MVSTLNSRLLRRSFLLRLLQTTGLSVALMTASAAGVYAEDVTVQGSAGVDGADGVNPGDLGQPGGDAGGAPPVQGAPIRSIMPRRSAVTVAKAGMTSSNVLHAKQQGQRAAGVVTRARGRRLPSSQDQQ